MCLHSQVKSGFVIFTYLGYMAHSQNKNIEAVADQGPGLVFEVYPQAVATLPGSQFWSVIFFFMLIMLGMDSAVRRLLGSLLQLKNAIYFTDGRIGMCHHWTDGWISRYFQKKRNLERNVYRVCRLFFLYCGHNLCYSGILSEIFSDRFS